MTERIAVVIVTYNRADLLAGMLDGLAAQTRQPDAVIVIDNASADHTRTVLDRDDLPLRVTHSDDNLGGAGGFHLGVKQAYEAGFDRIWLMDDDVVPAPDCLAVLADHENPCLMAVREDLHGNLVEKSAIHFDLRNPLRIRPKTACVDQAYASRADLPAELPIENVAFEGFMVHRRVIDEIGLPDPSYFIFYDDVDFAVRARRAGFTILALRDAVLVRQLDFNQQHALDTWKGSTCSATSSSCTSGTARTRWCAPSVADRDRGPDAEPVPWRTGRGHQRDQGHPVGAPHAATAQPWPTRSLD